MIKTFFYFISSLIASSAMIFIDASYKLNNSDGTITKPYKYTNLSFALLIDSHISLLNEFILNEEILIESYPFLIIIEYIHLFIF